jgi:hypothetical protein
VTCFVTWEVYSILHLVLVCDEWRGSQVCAALTDSMHPNCTSPCMLALLLLLLLFRVSAWSSTGSQPGVLQHPPLTCTVSHLLLLLLLRVSTWSGTWSQPGVLQRTLQRARELQRWQLCCMRQVSTHRTERRTYPISCGCDPRAVAVAVTTGL